MNPRVVHLQPERAPLPAVPHSGAGEEGGSSLKDRIIAALQQVFDPEIPVNIYDLGLVYKLEADEGSGQVTIDMTLTTPNCPEAEALPRKARQQVEGVAGVKAVTLNLVWEPAWDKSRMSAEIRLALGLE